MFSSDTRHRPVSVNVSRRQSDDQPLLDVHAHPAALAYAAAHPRRTIPKFGPYLLLQTLGEGEFGKVKLGLHSQWGEEVAVKLIRRGNIDSSVRMSKVEREIEVLRTLKHPNIVRLYDVIETDKYIGIILEYASGGELFDHILAHRYLREKDAAKLFAQLVSGVWYIHQKKIVHRDLKLENLLLDRHRNVIITDFGFANRFEHRADDLMQTSCGSPCYAAPELVISEGLYVGSAVDIWSCGVILYAMLAGYLPFDDDPANPDGDNINLLYKYIVNTPLSFPDYVSIEARDLLSMMLVPEPTRRADLSAVMAHPWLSAYASLFHKSVDDLERAAMEQHQMKRLAYQRQMKQAAAASATTDSNNQAKVSRSQSARIDPPSSVSPASRSRSYKDPATQPEFLYETTADLSSFSTPPSAHRKHHNPTGLSPSAPLGDDPFAPAPSHETLDVPTLSLPPDAVMASVPHRDSRSKRTSRDRDELHTAPPIQPPRDSLDVAKKPGGFRHTIQVEYGEPSDRKERRSSTQKPVPVPAVPNKKDAEDTPRPEDRTPKPRTTPQNAAALNERPRKASTTKPLPVTPSPSRATPSSTTPRPSPPQTAVAPVSVEASPPAAAADTAGGPAAAEKSLQTMRSASGSTGSQSSKKSQHRKGLSIDKFGIGKIFGVGGAPNDAPSSDTPGLSIVTDVSNPKLYLGKTEKSVQSPGSVSKTSLTSPGGESGKKSRRNTLTVMVGPITRSIKSRSKVRGGGSSQGREKEKAAADADATPPAPPSALPTSASITADEGGGGVVVAAAAAEESAEPGFVDVSRAEMGVGSGMPASTNKARKVMQWFRTRSKGRESLGYATGDESETVRKGASASSAAVHQTALVGEGSPVQVVVAPPPIEPTTTTTKKTAGLGSKGVRAPGLSQRTASSATDSSFSPHSIAKRIRNSVGVVVPSSGSGGQQQQQHQQAREAAMRIHHGAVDQTTITTRAPPEVMKHVKAVLEEMGMEIQVESEFRYRCVRVKRRKASVAVGGSSSAGSVRTDGTLAAIQVVGSAASNGVDKRGLPVPQTFHGTGGMLRGLLMRRQSSQVSTTGTVMSGGTGSGSQPFLPLEDDSVSPIVGSEPKAIKEPLYGDLAHDAGDEVRFSVELTQIKGLKDTFSLDVRRIKGHLKSYKFLYDTIRERADLGR